MRRRRVEPLTWVKGGSLLGSVSSRNALRQQDTWSAQMQGKNCGAPLAGLLLAAVLIGAPAGAANELDRSGARTLELQRDLRSVRSRLERAPRASSFDLKELQRRLHDRRIDDPRDPRLEELALEIRRLRAKADREARAQSAALPRSSPLSSPAPIEKPRY